MYVYHTCGLREPFGDDGEDEYSEISVALRVVGALQSLLLEGPQCLQQVVPVDEIHS